jgi:hypothetical protein
VSRDKVRDALSTLATFRGSDGGGMVRAEGRVDPVAHLVGTAIGWGGGPPSATFYRGVVAKADVAARLRRTVGRNLAGIGCPNPHLVACADSRQLTRCYS